MVTSIDPWVLAVLAVIFGVLGTSLHAALELALLGLPRERLEPPSGHAQDRFGRAWQFAREEPVRFWLTLQTARLTAIALTLGGLWWLGEAMQWHPFDTAIMLGAASCGALVSGLGLRVMARRSPARFVRATVPWARILAFLLAPVLWPLAWAASLVGRLWVKARPFWTADDLLEEYARARSEGLGNQGEDLLDSIIEFSDTVIKEIMVARTEMHAVPISASSHDVLQAVVEGGHSRIPVYEDTADNIIGLLHVKDLVRSIAEAGGQWGNGYPFSLKKLLRPTFYVPEVMQISELLKEFQRRKTHMAIVIDEYGGTAGIVTLEDIIEEIVGEIHDEYDIEEKQFRALGNKIIADGRVPVYDLQEVLGVQFPQDSGFETLAGFLMFQAGQLPEPGTVIDWNGLRFTVKEANEKRIATVEIERLEPSASTG